MKSDHDRIIEVKIILIRGVFGTSTNDRLIHRDRLIQVRVYEREGRGTRNGKRNTENRKRETTNGKHKTENEERRDRKTVNEKLDRATQTRLFVLNDDIIRNEQNSCLIEHLPVSQMDITRGNF